MAGVGFLAQSSEISTGTSKRTLLQILAATNQRVLVKEIWVDFQGTSNTAAPILVEIAVQSTTPAGSDTVTPQKLNAGDNETLQLTAAELFDGTDQPTETNVIFRRLIHPQGGFTWQAPFGGEIPVLGGGRLGIAVTAGAAVDAVAGFKGTE
jgi:hypothetical protein